MRKWGKWVAEIWESNKWSRIWLGSYSMAVDATHAYDIAVFYLHGRFICLNFPNDLPVEGEGDGDETEVGTRVDALHTMMLGRHQH
ncbi:hypothetical protein Taro_002168 [Colocasia esculenta]|uniref:AP2/ERF domain-containing protein n=1 Tax=Colocasia esculenta TaxID=4460 RepID=A0A843TC18_COLES|nr:hypothetical protein [Colocasia esculenta]